MRESEIRELLYGMYEYGSKVIEQVRPIWGLFVAGVSYVLFPDQAYVPPTIGLCIALVLDVITKYYAISKKCGGFWKAIKAKKITSESMWKGTKKKLLSILVVMIACGLLIRFTPFLPEIAITITTIAYAFMFYREIQSVVENMIEAGHDDLTWFLDLIKRRKSEILDEENFENKNYNSRTNNYDNNDNIPMI